MYTSATTLDDLMHEVLEKLIEGPFDVSPSRGENSEIIGALLILKNPRARVSRTETKGTIFSAIGELLWYLSGKDDLDFIQYYIPSYEEESPDGKIIHGAYGPRLFNMEGKYNQVFNIIDLLREKPHTRKAVIQLFKAEDVSGNHKEIPCTCTLQFLNRQDKLHMFTSMRSNDAFLGLPHDVFAFTMLQEIIARSLSIEIGEYHHAVGSLHLYEKRKKLVKQYLKEGFQSTQICMPSMPIGDPWPAIAIVLDCEHKIRNSEDVCIEELGLDEYWSDLIRLLEIFSFIKKERYELLADSHESLSSPIYNTYIRKRLDKLRDKLPK